MTRIRDTDNVSIECRMSGISRTLSKIDPVSSFDRSVSIYCAEDARNGCQTIENYGAVANIESVAFIGMDGSIDSFCYPEFDSPTAVAALPDDARAGSL